MHNPATLPSLQDHYRLLLGLVSPWTVANIDLDVEKATLDIYVVEHPSHGFPCPECETLSGLHDHAPERRWRHLDTMQFKTEIVARLPRITCATHGVKTIAVPWADPHARWTLLFEAFAIEVLLGTSNIVRAMALLRIGWDSAQAIEARAVKRGLARRSAEEIFYVGIDEKSFRKGHDYVSTMTDLDRGRVMDVVKDHTQEATEELIIKALSQKQRASVKAGAMDFWKPFTNGFKKFFPQAAIVHDKYHIAAYLSKMVDKVRRKENGQFLKAGDDTLKGSKYLWLTAQGNWSKEQKKSFREMKVDNLKTGRAWSIKETFRHFWEYSYKGSARAFFDRWYFWATHSKLEPVIEVAKMLKRHFEEIVTYLDHGITNAVTEGLNSKIQSIKANARGFRNFENYRVAILFHCGKLEMLPQKLPLNSP